MTNLARVQAWIEAGALLPPVADRPSSVHLARALGHWAGVPGLPTGPHRDAVAAFLDAAHARQIVFVLIDGLGCNLLAGLPPTAFLRRARALELRAVFPSTTAAAVTSIATGHWPATHAVPGWFTYLAHAGRTATILPFVDRISGTPLQDDGIAPTDVFPQPSLAAAMTAAFRPLQPSAIADSVYTRHHWGPGCTGYDSLPEAVDRVLGAVADADTRTLHLLYLPSVDAAEHHHGFESPQAAAALAEVDAVLARLARALPPDARLAVSSDHGMLTTPDHARHTLAAGDPLLDLLRVPPSGEPRVPLFHIRPGAAQAFAAQFRERLGHRFALLTRTETETLQLWGPQPLTATAAARVGDYVALSAGPDVLLTACAGPPAFDRIRGFHAGLTPAEMRIPCIVA